MDECISAMCRWSGAAESFVVENDRRWCSREGTGSFYCGHGRWARSGTILCSTHREHHLCQPRRVGSILASQRWVDNTILSRRKCKDAVNTPWRLEEGVDEEVKNNISSPPESRIVFVAFSRLPLVLSICCASTADVIALGGNKRTVGTGQKMYYRRDLFRFPGPPHGNAFRHVMDLLGG